MMMTFRLLHRSSIKQQFWSLKYAKNQVNSKPIARFYVDLSQSKDDTDYFLNNPTSGEFVKSHFEGGRYHSPWSKSTKSSFSKFLQWQMSKLRNHKERFSSNHKGTTIPVKKSMIFQKEHSHITWLGHSTLYFQSEGIYFLTDPVFSNRCSPIPFLGPHRSGIMYTIIFLFNKALKLLDLMIIIRDAIIYGSAASSRN